MRRMLFLVSIALAACGTVEDTPDPGPTQPPPPPAPGRELAPAAGRLAGGTWKVDVLVGSSTSQSGASGGKFAVRGSAPLIP